MAALAGLVFVAAPGVSGPSTGSAVVLSPQFARYPHEAYAYGLARTLQRDPSALDWVRAAERSVLSPQVVELPYSSRVQLGAAQLAAGYRFSAPEARSLRIEVTFEAADVSQLFVDLFQIHDDRYERVAGALPGEHSTAFEVAVLNAGDYLLRAQTERFASASLEMSVVAKPLLTFPVEGATPRAMWSGFGAERDGGRRAHRGVDIFAARGTPVLAATDGWVTRVETTRVGGNVVWLQPLFGNMRLYYAHLERQFVSVGEFVNVGQPLGSVGNTGNAVTTPPHLHFGVYLRRAGMRGGARDPAKFLR